jgi:hypothetical protein
MLRWSQLVASVRNGSEVRERVWRPAPLPAIAVGCVRSAPQVLRDHTFGAPPRSGYRPGYFGSKHWVRGFPVRTERPRYGCAMSGPRGMAKMLAPCAAKAAAVAMANAGRPTDASVNARTRKKTAGAIRPRMSPSSVCVAPRCPCVRCVKTASTAPKTGNGESRPARCGPRSGAEVVMSRRRWWRLPYARGCPSAEAAPVPSAEQARGASSRRSRARGWRVRA